MPYTLTSAAAAESTLRTPSSFWADCPWDQIRSGVVDGVTFFDDFNLSPGMTTLNTANVQFGQWSAYGDTGNTVTTANEAGGVLIFTVDTDNEQFTLKSRAGSMLISTAAKNLWFEARVKVSSITDTNCGGCFFGLYEGAAADANIGLSANVMADANFVGWNRLEADGDQWEPAWKADGVAVQVGEADAYTIVADTYYKLGFKWDFALQKLFFYVNGVVTSSHVGSTVVGASASPTTFPNDVYLGPMITVGAGGTPTGTTSVDWIRGAQVF